MSTEIDEDIVYIYYQRPSAQRGSKVDPPAFFQPFPVGATLFQGGFNPPPGLPPLIFTLTAVYADNSIEPFSKISMTTRCQMAYSAWARPPLLAGQTAGKRGPCVGRGRRPVELAAATGRSAVCACTSTTACSITHC